MCLKKKVTKFRGVCGNIKKLFKLKVAVGRIALPLPVQDRVRQQVLCRSDLY